ncbi:MAG: hypothetical protein E7678_02490 [Ruminococcaceae bacterium]|nr:hypothetical protein [Oscillospiraceae bacterium]
MKKTFVKSICLICAFIMASLTLFSCNSKKNDNTDDVASDIHIVKFNTNGGNDISSVEVSHGQKVSAPPSPTRENYIFLRWEHNARPWIFNTDTVEEDITISALWISADKLFKTAPTDNPDELIITGFSAQKDIYNLVIPEKINGKTVVGISDGAFESIHEQHAHHLTIPSTVRTIGESALQNIAMVHIKVLGTVNSIGVSSFEDCITLESIKLGEGLTTIPHRCFFGATALKAIDIPEGVTVIEEDAFSSCTSLQSVVLPSTLKTIEDSAFLDSSNITVVFFKGTEEQFDTIDISDNNDELISVEKIYFYSETEPTEKGDFWHYDKNNTPILWQ